MFDGWRTRLVASGFRFWGMREGIQCQGRFPRIARLSNSQSTHRRRSAMRRGMVADCYCRVSCANWNLEARLKPSQTTFASSPAQQLPATLHTVKAPCCQGTLLPSVGFAYCSIGAQTRETQSLQNPSHAKPLNPKP